MQAGKRSLALGVINLSLLAMLAVLIVLLWQALSGDAREGAFADAILVRAPHTQVTI